MSGYRIPLSLAAVSLLLAWAAGGGCCRPCGTCCKSCNDITPGSIPRPAGTYDCQWIHAEMARADQEYFVIYQYEWSSDPAKLSPFGQQHVARLAEAMPQSSFSIVIEPVSDERLNLARQAEILASLARCRVDVPPDRVVFGRPTAEGLYGQEAPAIALDMLRSRNGASGLGTGFGGVQSGTFGPSQGGIIGTTQVVPYVGGVGGGLGSGIGGY